MKPTVQLYPFRWVGQNAHNVCHHKRTARANDPDSMVVSIKHQGKHAAWITSVSADKTQLHVCDVECAGYETTDAAIAKEGS